MTLVSYSDSEEDDEPVAKRPKKHADNNDKNQDEDDLPPPLPASFLNLYSSSVRVSNTDDPSLHHGRKRIVKHVEGNWPTHVYLEWLPSPSEHETLNKLLTALPESLHVHSLLQTPLQVPLPLHVSLSAPIVLRTENKDDFLDTITDYLTPIIRPLRQPIAVRPASLSWHGNEDKSRFFLVLRIQNPTLKAPSLTTLNSLLNASNSAAKKYNQPLLYTKPQTPSSSSQSKAPTTNTDFSPYFHISIGWALPPPDQNLEDQDLTLRPEVQQVLDKICEDMVAEFDAVKIRIGQTVTALQIGGGGGRGAVQRQGKGVYS